MRSRSVMWYRPCGFMSARWGTRRPIREKSSRCSSTRASFADREQMEHGVGRAAKRHHDGDRVLERLFGHDLARSDALFEQGHHRTAARVGEVVTPAVDCRRHGPGRQCHAKGLGHRSHGVGGEHAGTGAFCRAGIALDRLQLCRSDRSGWRAPTASNTDTMSRRAIAEAPGQDRPPVDEDHREVEPTGGHEHPGQRLVTPCEADESIEALRVHHGFDGVGDDLPADERRMHPLVAHCYAVGDGDRDELEGEPAGQHAPRLSPAERAGQVAGCTVSLRSKSRRLRPVAWRSRCRSCRPRGSIARDGARLKPSVTSWLWILSERILSVMAST